MKVLRVKSRKYKTTQYYKYRVNLPEELLKEAGFKEGDELEGKARKGEILLKSEKK